MNILVASVDALPKVGGISLMAHALCNALVTHGHRVVFLGPRGTFVPHELRRSYHLYEDWESETRRRSGPEGAAEDGRIRELFELMLPRYGIDRVLLLHPFYYAIGALDACREHRLPCSVYFHGYELQSQIRNEYPKNQQTVIQNRRVSTLRERVIYSVGVASEILVNSEYTRGLVMPFKVRPPIRVTGCGIDRDVFLREQSIDASSSQIRANRRAELGLSRLPCLTFLGRLIPAKRAIRLLEMCRYEPGLSALFIGTGPEEANLRELAARYGLESRVTFTGAVSEARKWELLRASDFLCLLSEPDPNSGQVEGFGIALLEGAAAGAVPVSSGTGGMGDFVEHMRSGIIAPPDDCAAAALLADIAHDPATMGSLVNEARSRIARFFTWEGVAQRILEGWT